MQDSACGIVGDAGCPGTRLRRKIPVRTEHRDIGGAGWVEADTVAHFSEASQGSESSSRLSSPVEPMEGNFSSFDRTTTDFPYRGAEDGKRTQKYTPDRKRSPILRSRRQRSAKLVGATWLRGYLHLKPDWAAFLEDFREHWPTDAEHTYVDFIRHGAYGKADARRGNARWRRITEERVGAKSVFHFDVLGSVAKSTHAGLPWLADLRRGTKRVHFWPFDGWTVPEGHSAVVEVYPSLWKGRYGREGRTPDQPDAYTVARWLQETDLTGQLLWFFAPELLPHEKTQVQIEGWILGVM